MVSSFDYQKPDYGFWCHPENVEFINAFQKEKLPITETVAELLLQDNYSDAMFRWSRVGLARKLKFFRESAKVMAGMKLDHFTLELVWNLQKDYIHAGG